MAIGPAWTPTPGFYRKGFLLMPQLTLSHMTPPQTPRRSCFPLFLSRRVFASRVFAFRALSIALASAVLLGLGAVRPAQAQLDTQTVAVLDFEVLPGLDPNLGRKAADALAVELQTFTANEPVARQRIEVVPRQRMLQTIYDTTALSPPYTDIIQSRLARATGSSSVYSGRVLSAFVNPGKSARVAVEVVHFELAMGDYSNGAIASQLATSPLGDADSDLLIDEALNKAIYAAVLEIKRKPFPIGTVQVVTRDEAIINLGFRNGVSRGQRYAILRDIYRGRDATDRDIVERVKIGEMIITKVDVDQASGILTAGGGAGVKISDKVRKIYIPSNLPQDLQDRDAKSKRYLTPDQMKASSAADAARRAFEEQRLREEAAVTAERESYKRDSNYKEKRRHGIDY
jgi:uncharacterized protein YaiI (UPF0178 family)